MKLFTQNILVLLISIQTGWVVASEVYKSVDETGKVTYSSEPPEDSIKVDKVDIAPGPSKESITQAQQTHEKTKQTANTIDTENKKIEADRDQQQKARDAEEAKSQKTAESDVYRDQRNIGNTHPVVIAPPRPAHPIARPPHGQPGHPANHPAPAQRPSR